MLTRGFCRGCQSLSADCGDLCRHVRIMRRAAQAAGRTQTTTILGIVTWYELTGLCPIAACSVFSLPADSVMLPLNPERGGLFTDHFSAHRSRISFGRPLDFPLEVSICIVEILVENGREGDSRARIL